MPERHPLRYWWAAPALALLIMLGTWAYSERPRIPSDMDDIDTRFLVAPRAELEQEPSDGEDAWVRLDWTSRHDGNVRYHELDLWLEGAPLRYVGHDPDAGEWSAFREDLYLSSADRARDGDRLVIGSDDELSGSRVRIAVKPCNCYADKPAGLVLR